jgi:hypothetical protein
MTARTYIIAGLLWIAVALPVKGAAPDAVDSKLESARENLRISRATEQRIAGELDGLRKSGRATPEVLREYETYLARVQAMVVENRRIVRDMEAVRAAYAPEQKESAPKSTEAADSILNPKIPEQQAVDELTALDRELTESLGQFDEMLLKQLDKIRQQSAGKMRDLAEQAAAAAKRLRDKTAETESEENGTVDKKEDEAEKGSAGTQKAVQKETGEGGTETAAEGASRQGSEGPSGKPKGYSGGKDDDIVARQLREAAENETDPELKAKLWKEYEEYKKNTTQ